MDESVFQKYSKYRLALLFLVVVALSIYIVLPFITSLIAAAVITYIFYPVFKKLNRYIKSKGLCSMIMILVILLIVIIPIFLVLNTLFQEATIFYKSTKGLDLTPITGLAEKYLGENVDISFYVKDVTTFIVSFLIKAASDFFLSLPQKILVLFIIIFVMYYLFKDGDKVVIFFEKVFPMRKDHRNELIAKFSEVINATIYGLFLSSVIQGIVGTIGLAVFDVPSPIIWGAIMVLAAMLPVIGTGLVWAPAAILKILDGELFNGFGLLIYGLTIVSFIDNLIKPKLISNKSSLHPVLIILGIFGGLKVFGIIGIIVGPLFLGTLSVLYTFYVKK